MNFQFKDVQLKEKNNLINLFQVNNYKNNNNNIIHNSTNFLESSPKTCNGITKSDDDDDAPLLKKSFELSETIRNNVERTKRPRVCFLCIKLYFILFFALTLIILFNLGVNQFREHVLLQFSFTMSSTNSIFKASFA